MAHMRVHGSYALEETLAKLTRLECGTRAGWQCKFIQNSKEPSARSTSSSSPPPPHVSLPISVFLSSLVSFSFSLSRRLCPSGGRRPRLPECSVHREKRLIIRQKIRHSDAIRSDRPLRSHCGAHCEGVTLSRVTKSALSNRELNGGRRRGCREISKEYPHAEKLKVHIDDNHIAGLNNRVSRNNRNRDSRRPMPM